MKKIVVLLLGFVFILSASAKGIDGVEQSPKKVYEVYEVVEEKPSFVGGESAFQKYVVDNLVYPAESLKNKTQGRVTLRFTVTETGDIADVKVIRGVDSFMDKEAKRIVENMPKWNPGKQDGKNVAVYFTLPINFRIPEKDKSQN